ncbi:hypothetical protein L917_03105 [Phytophthora nicotianae]|uniref:NADP-dependent oxidoreductase domain-containing protein n=1 Tax=Phytophthora nicotianae TaxID=4792 RepID=W2LTZ0_PHYNI|nr:hypothetical protein L917_03105 [Phytophthora nicotianae]
MSYRFLGNSGLLVSKLSLGAWMQYKEENTVDAWYEMMKTAFQHGVNFFDTSEMYANGHAEKLQGGAVNKGIIQGVWSREDLVLTTKIFLGSKGIETAGPNDQGLSRRRHQGFAPPHGTGLRRRSLLSPS